MAKSVKIRFFDLKDREVKALQNLRNRQAALVKRAASLNAEERRDLTRINHVLLKDAKLPEAVAVLAGADDETPGIELPAELSIGRSGPYDPLFIGVRDVVNELTPIEVTTTLETHVGGELKGKEEFEFKDVVKISLLVGYLALDGVEAPPVWRGPSMKDGRATKPGPVRCLTTDRAYKPFVAAVWKAAGEVASQLDLAVLTLSWLEQAGDNDPDRRNRAGSVSTEEFARVMRSLAGANVTERDPQLERRIQQALDTIQNVGARVPLTNTALDLPDLLGRSDYQIQADNVRNIGAVIMTAMLEDLKVFQVIERLIDMSQTGTLAIGNSDAGELLYNWWRETPNRMSEMERRNFYATTIGMVGGDANGSTNREFNDLWIRFVSSVSSLVRQRNVDKLLRQAIPSSIGQQQVRKAARDLALNLSAHGYGMAYYTAREMRNEIVKIIKLLDHDDIKGAFGARDMWQVVDQVVALDVGGGVVSSARQRTLATCGAIITAWLANHVTDLNRPSTRPIIDVTEVLADDPPSAGAEATKKPTDYDLVNACELWLADTATSDDRIEQIASEPREAPAMSSKPIQIPAIAREYLQQAGVPGMGLAAMRR